MNSAQAKAADTGRWPLILRVHKGAIHLSILPAVTFHAAFTAIIVTLQQQFDANLGLPGTIVPSLAIVVGLMLVFRNGTSYDRFWTGRNAMGTCVTSVRNLTRSFLVIGGKYGFGGPEDRNKSHSDDEAYDRKEDDADTEKAVRTLIALLYAIKHSLRAEYSATKPALIWKMPALSTLMGSLKFNGAHAPAIESMSSSVSTLRPEYNGLLLATLKDFEDQGLGLPLQLTTMLEGFILRCARKGWIHAPGASQLSGQLNTLVDAYDEADSVRG